jgi:AcrR family transcriptional regulator
MARPKSASHDLKRDEILDVAARCFARQSFPAASMNDIAAACGTSKARLYHYYESKEAILFDLLDRYTQRLLALIGEGEARAQRKNLNERDALSELVRAFLAEYETPPGAPAPLCARWRRTRRAALAALHRWAWESPTPLRAGVARTLRRVPVLRGLLLRRLPRPDRRDAA